MALKSKRSKACAIPSKVKAAVWERDGQRCILCGSNQGQPNAHYIPRSHGGLGVEQNIITLCPTCHYRFDQTTERAVIKTAIANYLHRTYPDFDEKDLYYKKGCAK